MCYNVFINLIRTWLLTWFGNDLLQVSFISPLESPNQGASGVLDEYIDVTVGPSKDLTTKSQHQFKHDLLLTMHVLKWFIEHKILVNRTELLYIHHQFVQLFMWSKFNWLTREIRRKLQQDKNNWMEQQFREAEEAVRKKTTIINKKTILWTIWVQNCINQGHKIFNDEMPVDEQMWCGFAKPGRSRGITQNSGVSWFLAKIDFYHNYTG